MAAHQAPPSLGFSRQEHWSGLPFPSPMHESEKWKRSRSVVSDSSDPMDCSLPGSSIHGIFRARVLEWGAIYQKQFLSNYVGKKLSIVLPTENLAILSTNWINIVWTRSIINAQICVSMEACFPRWYKWIRNPRKGSRKLECWEN